MELKTFYLAQVREMRADAVVCRYRLGDGFPNFYCYVVFCGGGVSLLSEFQHK